MTLSQQLDQKAFGELWIYPAHDETVERIWDDGAREQELHAVIASEESSDFARFVACEVLFGSEVFFLKVQGREKVAGIYAKALAENMTGHANSWGLLYEHEDEGPVGIVFLMINTPAISALVPLLDDERTHLVYEGSEEATVGNAYGYRVKDFAAYYIGRIRNQKLTWYPEIADRDRQIEELKAELAK